MKSPRYTYWTIRIPGIYTIKKSEENLRTLRCVRDSNPWPHAWQACILTSWTNTPLRFFLNSSAKIVFSPIFSKFQRRKIKFTFNYIFNPLKTSYHSIKSSSLSENEHRTWNATVLSLNRKSTTAPAPSPRSAPPDFFPESTPKQWPTIKDTQGPPRQKVSII